MTMKNKLLNEKTLSIFFILYFTFGIAIAFIYAIYNQWGFFSFFSPGFYDVVFKWPIKLFDLIKDISYYGLAGKP